MNRLLSRLDSGRRISFDELLRTEFDAHGITDPKDPGSPVRLEGAQGILLRSSHVQTLALGIHEFATNALKYGALSQPQGRLSVSWHLIKGSGGERRLHVEWCKSGASPPAGEPDDGAKGRQPAHHRSGYGRELIEKALPYQLKAETFFELTSRGLRCSITLSVSAAMNRTTQYADETRDD
ncbi:sensor histidine kinase [Paracoccus albicereus]|uniref:sensor histidine kinase n=1 Tax=Paracoccus albicereus TaxID=2922394 RepID=UPI0021010536|nr:sensor histidine kinase [Paracoccus albicereus]